jgi:hypothetical protein
LFLPASFCFFLCPTSIDAPRDSRVRYRAHGLAEIEIALRYSAPFVVPISGIHKNSFTQAASTK